MAGAFRRASTRFLQHHDIAVSRNGPGRDPGSAYRRDGPTQGPWTLRIFLNRDQRIEPTPSWLTNASPMAADVTFADVNRDGFMDLVVAGSSTQVYYGHAPSPREEVPLETSPGFTSAQTSDFSYGVDYGQLALGAPVSLAVSTTSLARGESAVRLYTPPRREPVWSYQGDRLVNASKLLLADVNGDQLLDLAVGQWGRDTRGGPLLSQRSALSSQVLAVSL